MTSETASVAKGVFAFKGKKQALNSEDFISQSAANDGDVDRIERMRVCEELWRKCNDKIQNLQSELSSKIFRELLNYVDTSHSRVFSSSDVSRPRVSVSEIPAAALVMGVNIPDHAAMFSSLHRLLVKHVTPHVVSLHSSKCQALKSAILNIALQLVPSLSSQADGEEGDGTQYVINKSSCNMSDIVAWYSALYRPTGPAAAARARKKSRGGNAEGTDALASPPKRTTSRTPTGTPVKRQNLTPPADKSPRKYPASPAASRAGLRSGATPQKLREFVTSSKQSDLPTRINSSSENEPYFEKHSDGKSNSSCVTDGNSGSSVLSVSPVKTPVKELVVVLQREEFPDGNFGSPSLSTSPVNSQVRKPSNPKLPASPVTARTGMRGTSEDCSRNTLTPTKRGTPKKSRGPVGNGKPVETDVKSRLSSDRNASAALKRPLESSSVSGAEEENLLSDRHCGRPPVVVVLEDFESFSSHLLQDLITVCGYHVNEMPVVLIFGIATTIDSVHRSLPHRVTSLLSMEKFQAPSSSEYLSMVLHQVLLNDEFLFKLGGKVFDFVLDVFLYHDFSVLGFVRTFEYAMMEHFYKNKASILCRPLDEACKRAAQLSSNQLADVRSCDSFQRYVKRQSAAEQEKLMRDDAHTKKEIARLLIALSDFHACFYPMVFLLHLLVHKLPASPLGKQVREVYAVALLQNVFETDEYQQAFKLLRTMSRDELVVLLTSAIDFLSDDSLPPKLRAISEKLSDYRHQFDSISDVNYCDEETQMPGSPADILPKKTNFYALRKTLQERLKQQKDRKLTVYEKMRNETVDYIDSCFREYLVCPETLALHEVFYYTAVDDLRRRVCTAPRAAVQSALMRPYTYFKNEALNVTDGISAALPDICIVYKLHLECGRLINLYDWMQAFAAIVQPSNSSTAANADGQNISAVVQARFMRAISELQFLGFIKATKRKTDHVERLTWGPC